VSEPKKTYRPGMSIESNGPSVDASGSSGALGCFVRRKGNNAPFLLTNSHVMFPGFTPLPILGVYQPDYSSCCSSGDKIATPFVEWDAKSDATKWKDGKYVAGFKTKLGDTRHENGITFQKNGLTSETDCAIAALDDGVQYENIIRYEASVGGVVQPKEIKIKGAVDSLWLKPGPNLGSVPSDDQYVRFYSPTNRRLMYGTIAFFKTMDPSSSTVDTAWAGKVGVLWPFGISDTTAADDAKAGAIANIDQFFILPRPTPEEGKVYGSFEEYAALYARGEYLGINSGDSGTVVINHLGQVVAQIVRKLRPSDVTFKNSERGLVELQSLSSMVVASPINAVLERLDIEIPTQEGWSGTAPSAGRAARVVVPELPPDPEIEAQRRGVARLREGLLATRRGRLLLGKITQHRREVRDLMSRVRAIAAAWHELGGPAFYHHCLQSVRHPGHQVPASINGTTRDRLVAVLLPLLARHASPALRRDIERHRAWAAAALLPVVTLDEVPAAAARRWSP